MKHVVHEASPVEVLIRVAQDQDAEALHRNCYPDQSIEQVRDYLAWCLDPRRCERVARLVAVVGGQVVGAAELTLWPGWGEVGSLVVAPPFRSRGVGRHLLAALIERARQHGVAELALRVERDNLAARNLYARAGFIPLETVPAAKKKLFLSDDGTHLVLHQVLPEPDTKSF